MLCNWKHTWIKACWC